MDVIIREMTQADVSPVVGIITMHCDFDGQAAHSYAVAYPSVSTISPRIPRYGDIVAR